MAKITTQLPGTIITGSVITKTSELINDGDTATSTYVEFTDIGLVAESNDYNDLTNLPNIPTNLDSLTDVTINSALNNDFLQFDSITSLWKNIQLTGALILSKLGFTPENISNKQNSLLVDGTGLKYPTVDAVNTALSSLSIPNASETVAGKVSVGTQTFGGNKTIVGESATVGNAFEVQNLSHVKLLQIANNKSVGLNVNPISNIGLSVGRGVFGGAGSSNFTVFADNTGTNRVLDVTNSQLLMYKEIFGAFHLPITANVELSLLYWNATNGSVTIGTSTTNGTHGVISNFEKNRVNISTPITPPAGSSNGVYNCLDFRSTIDLTNISGTTIARGYYIHPTLTGLTSAKVFRAIETSEGGGYFNVGATTNVQSSAILQSDSTTQGFLPPRMTTAQKNAIVTPVAGLMVFDTTLMKLCIFTTVWETITSI